MTSDMDHEKDAGRHLALMADVVAAYVSNNSLPLNDLPALMRSVPTLAKVCSGEGGRPRASARGGAEDARGPHQEVDHAGIPDLPGGRQEVPVPQAPSRHRLQHDARRIPDEMGSVERLSDGCAWLFRDPFQARQGYRPRSGSIGGTRRGEAGDDGPAQARGGRLRSTAARHLRVGQAQRRWPPSHGRDPRGRRIIHVRGPSRVRSDGRRRPRRVTRARLPF